MTDYLERLFVLKEPDREEKPEVEFRFSPLEGEAVEEMALSRLATEFPAESWGSAKESASPEIPFVPKSSMESIPPEELVRVYAAGEEPVFDGRIRRSVARPREQEAQETLERRLRRDSRRYDSGFFWY